MMFQKELFSLQNNIIITTRLFEAQWYAISSLIILESKGHQNAIMQPSLYINLIEILRICCMCLCLFGKLRELYEFNKTLLQPMCHLYKITVSLLSSFGIN